MAEAKGWSGQAELAICCLVDETRQGKKLLRRHFLGLGCLAKFESVEFLRPLGKPTRSINSKFFLVANKRAVLTKDHLMAIKKPRKDRKKISVKVVAEFLSMEDGKVLERRDLSELCSSFEKDVYDLNGVTYVALTNEKGSSFLRSRCLEVYNFSEESESSVLWDQLQCLVFSKETVAETIEQERPVAFSTRIYDLFHCDHVFAAGDDSQFGNVNVSTSPSRKRFRKEDEFAKGDVPLGAIIATKDCQLAGFLDFYNKHPVPLLFGSNFQETGETMTHTGQESQGCASGSVSHTSYQSQLAGLRSRALCLEDYLSQPSFMSSSAVNGSENSGAGEMALQQQNVESYGEEDVQNNESRGPFPSENSDRFTDSCRHLADYSLPKDVGKIESELPVGAVGGIYTPVESHILAGSHISASGGSDDKSNPGGTAQLGEIKYTLDDKMAAAAEKDTNTDSCEVYVNERSSNGHLLQGENLQAVEQCETGSELTVGTDDAGGIYPPVESHIPAGSHISASGGSDDKSNPGGTAQPGEIKCTLDDKVAAAAEGDTGTDSSEVHVNGRSSNEGLPQEGNCSQAVEQGETESELPVGAAGGICPPVDSNSLAGSHSSVSGGDDKSNPVGNTQPGEIKHNLDNKVAAVAEKDTDLHPSKGKTEEDLAEEGNSWAVEQGETGSELPAGASGGIYPQVKPDLVAGCHITAGSGAIKSDPDGTALPRVVKHTLDDKVAAAAESDAECVVNGDHSLKSKDVDNTSSKLIPPDGLGCQPVTPLTEISSGGAINTGIKLTKIPSDKAQIMVPQDGISRPSTFISEEATRKEATTFLPPSHNHKDTTPSSLVDPPDRLSGQPSSLPSGVVSGGARSIETKAASLPLTNHKETIQSRRFPPSGSVRSQLPSQALIVGASSNDPKSVKLPCKSDKDKGPTRAQPEGLSIQASSDTTDRAGNDDVKVVALPAKNDRTQSGVTAPSGLSSQRSSATTAPVPEGASNVESQEMSTSGHRIAGTRFSCLDDSAFAKKEELRSKPKEKKRKFKPTDPLAETILGCLDLLEGLSRCLDKEYKYGSCKCWKHLAESFNIGEQEYQKFNCSQVHSPTEVMFEYLQTRHPEITIANIKDGLHSILREDVVHVLVKYEKTYDTVHNGTLVCSLFDSDPDIIGEIAFLLDMQKKGLKNWSYLAASLEIPRKDFKTFETCNTDCPAAERLFELVKIKYPRTTVMDLISHLDAIKRHDVIAVIRECTKEYSLLKDLMEDLDVMENVCELLNQKQRTNRVKNWSHLGRRFNFKKEILDDFSASQEEIVCPTEALIQHLRGSHPNSTLQELILKIHLIDRDDALEVLDDYLQDGCIANVLRLCHCERCEKAKEQEKGHADGR